MLAMMVFFSISISELFNELKNFFKNRRCKPRKFGIVPSDLELLKLFFGGYVNFVLFWP